MTRAYYSERISEFIDESIDSIYGKISGNYYHQQLILPQANAWKKQIEILKKVLNGFQGTVYFEFSIPRMGKRVDNILIIQDFIFVLEFKVGDTDYKNYAIEQCVDYCLDLQNFHEGSHHEKIVPILVSTNAHRVENQFKIDSNLFKPLLANETTLEEVIRKTLHYSDSDFINPRHWEQSTYKPTPTIIEASQALYRGHSVSEISRSDAGTKNLTRTTECINRIIEDAKQNRRKCICLLTGVPGAGKTLAGLNIANERRKAHQDENAVFLSGNGPLVYVLREALVRDEVRHAKEKNEKMTKKQSAIKANAFIQNIHNFRDDNLIAFHAPNEKVVVFDEAQRAWTKEKASSFMNTKGKEFSMSEPEFLIEVMNRHQDYCTIICLIGGGQEINTGEAGLSEWVMALKNHYSTWEVHYSNLITLDSNYINNYDLVEWLNSYGNSEPDLHLAVSVRSFRSEKISSFVSEVIDGDILKAATLYQEIKKQFPIYLTRDFRKAKDWLRQKARGTERIGLVASSGAKRLRPFGIDVKNTITAEEWFLNDASDVRSSNYLESISTEFDIQGLEIDYVCLAWDINFYYDQGQWNYQSFEGTNWKNIKSELDKTYLRNAYRVLLTRARQGMIIFIPHGDNMDRTRPCDKYDAVYDYFRRIGIQEV